MLVVAGRRARGPRTAALHEQRDAGDPLAAHLAAERARLLARDWTGDDSIASPLVPIGPTGTIATAFGSTYGPAYDWTSQCLKTPEEIDDLEPPRLGDGLTGRYLEGVRYVAEQIGDALVVCYAQVMQGPFSTCSMVLDDQVLLEPMYTHPDQIHRLLGMVTDFIIEFAQAARGLLPRPVPTSFSDVYFPDGQGICLCDDLAAAVSPWLYGDFVLPHMHRIADLFGGLFVHACGNPAAVLPVWGEIRGFRGFDIGATETDLPQVFRRSAASAVIVCHVGLNSAPHFPSRLAAVEDIPKHVTPDSSLLINATGFVANMPAVSPDEWDPESAQIVECVRAHSKQ